VGQVTDNQAKSAQKAGGDGPATGPQKSALSKFLPMLLGIVVAIGVAVAIYAYRGGFDPPRNVAEKDKVDPSVDLLMAPGPLPDIVVGSANAPYTIVEYASMTCPHCAQFTTKVLPLVKSKYIDTGKAKYIMREFPLDNLAVAAFMLARCSGDDRYYPMIDALFETQENWAVPSANAKDKLLQIARQAGISKEEFDKCLADKELFGKIVAVRDQAHDKFQVDSTPTFFVNGRRLKGDHQIEDFDVAMGEAPAKKPDAEAPAGDKPAADKPEGTSPPGN
jgi:protein-disulfide isomerase